MSKIARHRLHNQLLTDSRLKQPHEVVGWLAAMQAQDYLGALWSLGMRLPGSIDRDIEQGFADKTFVRTWVMRGTLHFVVASDIHWMVALLAPGLIAGNMRRYRELELDEKILARTDKLLARALQDGTQLNRTEMMAILEKQGISTEGQRAPYILQHASLHRLMYQVAVRRNDPVYMALPEGQPLPPDEARAELARRYFTSRGPATLQDFVWWSGLPTADARQGLDAIKAQLDQETIGKQTYWWSGALPKGKASQPTAYLLPSYDEYLIGYKDRSASLDELGAAKMWRGNGFSATIAIEGRIVGTWKRTLKKGSVVIDSDFFAPLSAADKRAFAAVMQRYGEFLALPVTRA
jgi:hypothetical protein